jgi:hypothetical protein
MKLIPRGATPADMNRRMIHESLNALQGRQTPTVPAHYLLEELTHQLID